MIGRFGIQALSWVLALAVGANLGVGPVRAQAESGEKIYQRTLRGTVWIVVPRGEPGLRGMSAITGTGCLIDQAHRIVVTNYHVVGDNDRVLALFPAFPNGKLKVETSYYSQQVKNGSAIQGEVIAKNAQADLALVRLKSLPQGVHAIRLASEGVSPGQRVHSIGNPGSSGALWVYTSGTVRTPAYAKRWAVKEGDRMLTFKANVIETQSATNQGDSGGPLVNDQGDLVAVTHGYAPSAQLLSLFIDVSEVRKFLGREKLLASLPSASPGHSARPNVDKSAVDDSLDENAKLEHEASSKLKLAKALADEGRLERAKDRFEKIISDYPKTKAAVEAKTLLDNLNK
jgi:S1-C subfamily serine protease